VALGAEHSPLDDTLNVRQRQRLLVDAQPAVFDDNIPVPVDGFIS
jgi:hypothetical protein